MMRLASLCSVLLAAACGGGTSLAVEDGPGVEAGPGDKVRVTAPQGGQLSRWRTSGAVTSGPYTTVTDPFAWRAAVACPAASVVASATSVPSASRKWTGSALTLRVPGGTASWTRVLGAGGYFAGPLSALSSDMISEVSPPGAMIP